MNAEDLASVPEFIDDYSELQELAEEDFEDQLRRMSQENVRRRKSRLVLFFML